VNQQLTQDGGFATYAPLYREKGLPVVPYSARGGRLLWPEHWLPDPAAASETLFESWCSAAPRESISLALGPASGVCIIDVLTTDPEQIATIRSIVPRSVWQRTGGHGVAGAYRWHEGFLPFVIRHPVTLQIMARGFGAGQYTAMPPSVRYDTPSYEANCFLGDVLDQLRHPPGACYERLCAALGVPEEDDRGLRPLSDRKLPWRASLRQLSHQFANAQRVRASGPY
jgi:hypothetical protein